MVIEAKFGRKNLEHVIAGGFLGGFFGGVCWKILMVWLGKRLDQKHFCKKTTEDLRAMLCAPDCRSPRVVLLELGMRGEKMENYLPIILDLLLSPNIESRAKGWFTLISVFPDHAKLISDYRVDSSVERNREIVQKLLPVQV